MRNKVILFIAMFMTATLFGVYAQDIGDGLTACFPFIHPLHSLSAVTWACFLLYAALPIVIYQIMKRESSRSCIGVLCILITVLTGLPVSIWALFVMAMSWG